MNRREALKRTSMILGYTVSAPVVAAFLDGCKAKPQLNYKPVFFKENEASLVAEIAEIIIPRTDTPGAKDTGVPGFIDALIGEVYNAGQQEDFRKGLAALDEEARKAYGDAFLDCTPEQQTEFIRQQNAKALEGSVNGAAQGWWNAGSAQDRPFILKIKELTLLGFFTSEAGATQVLQYNQVPGPFKGCVPLAEVGKAWAT
jgi:gluconate 2-dehydrogenase gamma chain